MKLRDRRLAAGRLAGILLAGLCLAAAAAASAKPYGDEVVKYDFGDSRKRMVAIEEQIRDATADEKTEIEKRLIDTLRAPDATYASRQWVCRMLRIVGTDRCVSAVAKLLDDEELSHMARYALQDIPHPEAGAALRQALDRVKGKLRVGVIDSLAARADEKAVGRLTGLVDSSDRDVARAAILALGRINGRRAASALSRADVPAALEDELAHAQLSCADQMLARGEKQQAAGIYRTLYDRSTGVAVRIAAMRGLARSGREKGASILLKGLRSDNVPVQQAAAKFIREVPGEEITRELAALLPSLGPEAQMALLGALADRGDRAATPDVAKLARSDNEEVRVAALRTLAELGDESHVTLLARMATSGGETARAAFDSLIKLQGEPVDRAIVAAVRDGGLDTELRITLIRSLAERGYGRGVPALLKTAQEPNPAVQTASFRALADLAGPQHAGDVVALLAEAPGEARSAAQSAAVAACGRIQDEGRRAAPVIAVLRRTEDVEARCALLGVLGELGGERALRIVRDAVRSDRRQVRGTAVRTLAGWPDAGALEPLLDLARDADERTHRILALRGFVRLLGRPSERSPEETVELYAQAMELAGRDQEKRLVLSGLADVPSAAALELIEPSLDDEQLKREAQAAYVEAAAGMAATQPAEARQALGRIAASAESDRVRSRAKQALEQVEKYGGYVLAWKLSGPYAQQGKGPEELFEAAFAPEKEGAEAEWHLVRSGLDESEPHVVNLAEIFGGNNRVAYLRARLYVPRRQKARLEIGSDDGVKAWLGGTVVHEQNTTRGLQPGQDRVNVTLQKGWNVLMLKVTQGGGGWAACARVRGTDGGVLEGLRISAR